MKMNDLKNELTNGNVKVTENGALGQASSGKSLLDINFAATSLRNMKENEIYSMFVKAFYEDKLLATKWLFMLRDVREGLGERRSFRVIINALAQEQPKLVKELIPLISEYGRVDDVLCLLDTDLKDEVIMHLKWKLFTDIDNMNSGKKITLTSKWMPRTGSKKFENRRYASILMQGFNIDKKTYNKMLKSLNEYGNVIENKISENRWGEVNYNTVPSGANLKYKNAFLKHDERRRRDYLDFLVNGCKSVKINAGVLMPHEIYHKYNGNDYDATLEALWSNLPQVDMEDGTIVVVDSSGSMAWSTIGNSSIKPIEVSRSMGIYFSQFLYGEFKNTYITFSSNPRLVNMSKCKNLYEKMSLIRRFNDCSNTNIEAVFDLILNVAVKNEYTQDELPKRVLILSDMEFDSSQRGVNKEKLFDTIKKEYAKHGYLMPKLVFNNLCSRTKVIPISENKNGVALISGFSTSIAKMIMSNKIDPYEILLEQLNSDRYNAVEEAFNRAV